MTTDPLKVTQPAQWQTRVQLRSNDGVRYEINRQILINRSGFFANPFQVPRPLSKGGTVETDQTIPLHDYGKSAVAAPSPTTDEDIDLDIPFNVLKLFADFMQLTDQFKDFVRSANLELDIHQAGILLPLIDKFDCELMRVVLKIRLASLAKAQPWEVLHLACEQDDLDMARTAISNLTTALIHKSSNTTSIDKNIWTKLEPLTEPWRMEFFRLYMSGTQISAYGLVVGCLNDKFAVWAKEFDPDKHQELDGVDGKRKRI